MKGLFRGGGSKEVAVRASDPTEMVVDSTFRSVGELSLSVREAKLTTFRDWLEVCQDTLSRANGGLPSCEEIVKGGVVEVGDSFRNGHRTPFTVRYQAVDRYKGHKGYEREFGVRYTLEVKVPTNQDGEDKYKLETGVYRVVINSFDGYLDNIGIGNLVQGTRIQLDTVRDDNLVGGVHLTKGMKSGSYDYEVEASDAELKAALKAAYGSYQGEAETQVAKQKGIYALAHIVVALFTGLRQSSER